MEGVWLLSCSVSKSFEAFHPHHNGEQNPPVGRCDAQWGRDFCQHYIGHVLTAGFSVQSPVVSIFFFQNKQFPPSFSQWHIGHSNAEMGFYWLKKHCKHLYPKYSCSRLRKLPSIMKGKHDFRASQPHLVWREQKDKPHQGVGVCGVFVGWRGDGE